MYIHPFWVGVVSGAGGLLLMLVIAALVQQFKERAQARRIMAALPKTDEGSVPMTNDTPGTGSGVDEARIDCSVYPTPPCG